MLPFSDSRPIYAGEDDDDDNLDDDEIDDEDLEDDDTSSSNPAEVTVAIAEPLTSARSSSGVVTVVTTGADKKPIAAFDDSRKLFQRLFTDEDEIQLLQGFLEYTGGAYVSKNMDTAPFYDQIRNKLQLDFNKNQLVEKLRRLKKKYRTVMGKINSGKEYVFKSPHEQARFEISKKIWCEPATRIIDYEEINNDNPISFSFNPNHFIPVDLNMKGTTTPKKRARPMKSEEVPQFCQPVPQVATPVANPMPGLVEETVKSCLTPIFKELVKNATSSSKGFGGMVGSSHLGLSFGDLVPLGCLGGSDLSNVMEEKWRKQQILELEVYSKRLALVQDQIKLAIVELRSKDD